MASNSWFLPVVLTIACVVLLINILAARNANKLLVEDIERARFEKSTSDEQFEKCNKQLQNDVAEIQGKTNRLSQLTAEVDAIVKEREDLKTKLSELQTQLTLEREQKEQALNTIQELQGKQESEAAKQEPAKADADAKPNSAAAEAPNKENEAKEAAKPADGAEEAPKAENEEKADNAAEAADKKENASAAA